MRFYLFFNILASIFCSNTIYSQTFYLTLDTDSPLDFKLTLTELGQTEPFLSKYFSGGLDSFTITLSKSAKDNRIKLIQFELYNEDYGQISGAIPTLNMQLSAVKKDSTIEVYKSFDQNGAWYSDLERNVTEGYQLFKKGDSSQVKQLITSLLNTEWPDRLDIHAFFIFQFIYLNCTDPETETAIQTFFEKNSVQDLFWGSKCLELIAANKSTQTISTDQLSALDIDGQTIRLIDLKTKKFLMLDFWATWCGPCHISFPKLADMHDQFADRLSIVGISIDKNREQWKTHVQKKPFPWPSLIDHSELPEKLERILDITAIPAYLLYDEALQLIYKGNDIEAIIQILQQ